MKQTSNVKSTMFTPTWTHLYRHIINCFTST